MADWEDAPDQGWEDADEVKKTSEYIKSGLKKGAGAVEAAGSLVAGLPSQIWGGLSGLGALMTGKSIDEAGSIVEDVQKRNFGAGQYSPSTDVGKQYAENVGKVFSKPGEVAGELGEKYGPSVGLSPELGALSAKLPVDTFMNFLPLKVPGAVKGAFEKFGRPGEKKFGEIKEPTLDAHLWEDAPASPEGQLPVDDPLFRAKMNAADEAQVARLEATLNKRNQPQQTMVADQLGNVEQLRPEQVDNVQAFMEQRAALEKQIQAQQALEARQRALEQEVAQRQGLDFNAAERARQEAAPTGYADWVEAQRNAANERIPGNNAEMPFEKTEVPYGLKEEPFQNPGMDVSQFNAERMSAPLEKSMQEARAWHDYNNEQTLQAAKDERDYQRQQAQELQLTPLEENLIREANKPEGTRQGPKTREAIRIRNQAQRGVLDFNELGNSLRKIYGKFEKTMNDLGKIKVPAPVTADEHARNIPGMGNAVDGLFVKPKTAADILPNILKEQDGPALWKGIQQGLSATAEKVGSSLMRYTSDWLNYVDKKTEFDYKKIVRPTQDRLTALPMKDKVALSKVLLNEMFNKKRFATEELQGMGLNAKQLEAYKALRDNLDTIADRYDASRALLGKEPIDRGQAYVAATRQGTYHVVLTDKEGRPIWHVAEHSKRDAYKFINWAKESLKDVPNIDLTSLDKHLQPGVLSGTVKSDTMHRGSNKFYNVPRDVLGAHLELAKLIDGADPSVSAIREAIQAAAEKAGYDVTNTKQRFMEKANVRGFNGDKPWLTPEENAVSLLNSQLQTIKEGLNWSYHQEMIAQMKELLANPELQKAQPNNVGIVNNVLQHQLGLSKSIFKDAEDWVTHNFFGADRAGLKKVVQDMKTFTYLQQLGMSAGYFMATPLQALNSIGAAMRERGLGALSPLTASKALSDGFSAIVNDFGLELLESGDIKKGLAPSPMSKLGKQALQYAEDNGIINKLVFNAGHEMPRVDKTYGPLSKAYFGTMSLPEKISRIMPFMAFVHHLDAMGTYKGDTMALFKRAEELTEFTQINFRSSEKPTLVKDMGSLGDLAYVYKGPIFNYFNQMSTYARNVVNGTNRAKNLMALSALVGVTAYLGGALSTPLISEMDGGYNVYKNAMAEWNPDKYNPALPLGIKGSLISKLDKSVAYGAISDITGAQMSSRFTPNMLDVEHPFSGVAPVATELGEQEAVAKFLHDPNKKNFLQGAYANSPPMIRGWMENTFDEFKGPKRADGTQTFVNPNNIGAQRAMVNRTPEQQAYRNWGLRELNEARKVDLNKINEAEQKRVQTAFEGTADKMFHAIVQEKDQQAARKYGAKMMQLIPDSAKFNDVLNKKINEWGTTPEERMQIKANVMQNLMKIKRLQDAAK